jgi:hypothetical protein
MIGDARHGCGRLSFEFFRVEKAHQSNRDLSLNFVLKLVAFLADGGLLEAFYKWPNADMASGGGQNDTATIKVSTRQQRRMKSAAVITEADEIIDFVVPDDDSVHLPTQEKVQQEPVAPVADVRRQEWYEVIQHIATINSSVGLEQALARVSHANEASSHEQQYNMVLADCLDDVQVSDIDEASSVLHNWRLTGLHEHGAEPSSEQMYRTEPRTLVEEYHRLTARYVGGIAGEVPDRARVQTERLVRNVALDISTSGIRIEKLGTVDVNESAPSQELPAVEELRISSPMPTAPSSPAKPSGDGVGADQDAPFSFLRRYTTFTDPSLVQDTPSAATNILAHLPTTLSNPADYSFTTIEAELAATQKFLALESMTERERRRVERGELRQQQREARQQKLREEAEKMSSFVPALAVKDPRDIQSSQGALDPGPQSSQSVLLPMTQPERGVFGERTTKKVARRGKRIKGF